MTYRKIPISSRSPADSAAPIKQNWIDYQTAFSVNHTPIADSNQGKHEKVTLRRAVGNTFVTGPYDILWADDVSSQAGTQLQLKSRIPQFLPNNVPNTSMQITYNQVVNSGVVTPSQTNPYQSFMIGGFLVFLNQTTIDPSTGTTVTLSPVPTKILSVIAQPCVFPLINVSYAVNIANNSQFQITVSPSSTPILPFSWIAICEA